MTDSMYVAGLLDTSVNCRSCFSTPTETYILEENLSSTYERLCDFDRGVAYLIQSQVKMALRNSGI